MNVLILGSGGREHALADAILDSKVLNKLYVGPGNAGSASLAENIALDLSDFQAVAKAALSRDIHMIIVGPEAPLVDGIVDFFNDRKDLRHIMVIGPDKNASQLEGSKDFAKRFMNKMAIPTARHGTFNGEQLIEAKRFLSSLPAPYVLKADGLAAGKGVLIIETYDEAVEKLQEMFQGKFGEAGKSVVIEEYLDGVEMSVFMLTDGESYMLLPEAKDYKRIGEGDTGLNTGGMGAVSPVPFVSAGLRSKIETRVVKPTLDGLKYHNFNYRGFVFIGLMIVEGNPFVIEYNVRMGDPETEVVLPRITSDLLSHLRAAGQRRLKNEQLRTSDDTHITVICASDGYPEQYEKGKVITGLEAAETKIYHAGTKVEGDKVVTSGGRVLAVTAIGGSLSEARKKVYQSVDQINFDGMTYRKDIGKDLL